MDVLRCTQEYYRGIREVLSRCTRVCGVCSRVVAGGGGVVARYSGVLWGTLGYCAVLAGNLRGSGGVVVGWWWGTLGYYGVLTECWRSGGGVVV